MTNKMFRIFSAVLVLSASNALAADYSLECQIDKRPIDGALSVFKFSKEADSGYSLHKTTEHFGFLDGREYTSTDLLAKEMMCLQPTLDFKGKGLLAFFCQVDKRPVDGGLTRVRVLQDIQGTYTITLETSVGPNLAGPEIHTSSKELAKGLECSLKNL